MNKIFGFISKNILFIVTLFLLAFIPLYPKIPLLGVAHTWVYIRVEDFAVSFSLILWIFLLLFKKVTLKTPLTFPILLFWVIGGISTLHGVLLLFPTLPNVFSNVAFLSFLRKIEYISLFFISYASIKDKKLLPYVVAGLAIVLLLIVGYGVGQKFYSFPAYLTTNEEVAKGIPIRLSQLSRIPSTFAGHYDLAAYLVLLIPIITSMAFGFRNWLVKLFLLVTAGSGFALLFMTVSRISFLVLLLSMVIMLILQKKRLVIASLFILTLLFLSFSPSLLQRFGRTVSETDVLVDSKTGGAIGQVKEVDASYFKDKVIFRERVANKDGKLNPSVILPFLLIPQRAALVIDADTSTGENLPQGTGYINLPLSPVTKKVSQFFYQKFSTHEGVKSEETRVIYGQYLIKRALAYDLSFTTRFQGEWPNAITAFKRSIFLGSGYSSVTLAVDNNYLRILGESGLLGFVSFLSIFVIAGIYIKKILPQVDSPVVRSFVFGFVAGTCGLALNAVLIDVFEASKVAFTYWLLMGITLGALNLYKRAEIDLYKEFKKVVFSTPAVIIYLFIITTAIFFSSYNNYFVGDDFTWFRWISDGPITKTIINYFTQANGFFYRPGAKLYFSSMYSAFWLNQTAYHLVSIFLHFSISALLFLISKKILKDYFLSAVSAAAFLILSGNSEAILWISATGFLFNALFALVSLLFFILWRQRKKIIYFIVSVAAIILSLMFHELGVVVPFLIIAYDIVFEEKYIQNNLPKKTYYFYLLFPILPYLFLRFLAHSHWFSGDYSYNLLHLPYNIIGNTIGYLFLALLGSQSLPFYEGLRNFSKGHFMLAIFASIIVIFIATLIYKVIFRKLVKEDKRIVIFGFLFFMIALVPFLGLGNIASRYSYLSSVGFVILFTLFLKKIFNYLICISDRYIAIMSIVIIAIIFIASHLFQLQAIHTDWQVAGEKSKRFLISLEEIYTDYWAKEPMKFYFVNVPIRYQEAWVFPVGLSDAVWFVFRNDKIQVYQMSSVDQALGAVKNPRNEKVFEFDSDGGIIERVKPSATIAEKK